MISSQHVDIEEETYYKYESEIYLVTFIETGGEFDKEEVEDEDCNAFVWSRREGRVSEEKNC